MSQKQQFRDDCQNAFAAFVAEGAALFPDARPSHLCVRSATEVDYAAQKEMAHKLGDVTLHHYGKEIAFVRLHEDLCHEEWHINWLELTAPQQGEDYATGPQMLIFARKNFDAPVKIPAAANPSFTLRCQGLSAAEILSRQA